KKLNINGTVEFKKQVVVVSARKNLNVTFTDEVLDQRRQDLINQFKKNERNTNIPPRGNHEEIRREKSIGGAEVIGRGRGERGWVGQRDKSNISRRRGGNGTLTSKPNIGRIGSKPPTIRQNGLRNLSQLGVVQFATRSEMLLQSDVPSNVEHKGTKR